MSNPRRASREARREEEAAGVSTVFGVGIGLLGSQAVSPQSGSWEQKPTLAEHVRCWENLFRPDIKFRFFDPARLTQGLFL